MYYQLVLYLTWYVNSRRYIWLDIFPAGAIFAYTDQKESEEDPDQAPGPWEWDCCGRSTDFDLDCMGKSYLSARSKVKFWHYS